MHLVGPRQQPPRAARPRGDGAAAGAQAPRRPLAVTVPAPVGQEAAIPDDAGLETLALGRISEARGLG